jgi:hypothetical protein
MTAAELEQVTAELSAIESEQTKLLGCFYVYELPDDLAAQWHAHASKDDFDPSTPQRELGPRAIWLQLLTWTMCVVSLSVALTWRAHKSPANPHPATTPTLQSGKGQ